MKLCFITNSSAQWVGDLGDFTLVLAHLCLKEYNPAWKEYRKFCRQQVAKQYVILDNSTYELKKPLETSVLLDLVEEIGFQEVVAPDYFSDAEATIRGVEEFVEEFKKRKNCLARIQAVVQGTTELDWEECFNSLNSIQEINVIGISITADKSIGRLKLIDWIGKTTLESRRKEYHALGLDDPRELITIADKYKFVTRNDSSTAVAQGMNGQRIGIDGKLPNGKVFMDFEKIVENKFNQDILWNVAVLRKISMGTYE